MNFDALLDKAREKQSNQIRGRYAPSPTGPLHLGNVRTALLAWLQTRLDGGVFIMRMEDLDKPRVRQGSAEAMLKELRWLGLDWDEGPDVGGDLGPYDQLSRTALYEEAMRRLGESGKIFPCYCSRKDIARVASAPHREGKARIYPGTCRSEKTTFDANLAPRNNRLPAWRYLVPNREIHFNDQITGGLSQDLQSEVGDFVLFRADGLFAYQLAVVVDDALMGVTDVVRGSDLLDSTPRQIELFESLGFPVPRFWHMPLVLGPDGHRLAKRDGSESIASYREKGITAPQLIGQMAASLGFVDQGAELSATELLQSIDKDSFIKKLRCPNPLPTFHGEE